MRLALSLTLVLLAAIARADDPAGILVLRRGFVVGGLARGGRVPFDLDAVQAALAKGTWKPPSAGETVTGADGKPHPWTAVEAGADGVIQNPALTRGAYFAATLESETERIALLAAQGHSMVYVNGEPRAGDPYGFGYLALPVTLHRGTNVFLFAVGRGRVAAKLLPVAARHTLSVADPTLPDFIVGEREKVLGAVVVINATEAEMTGRTLTAAVEGGEETAVPVPPVPPLTVRKVGFAVVPPKAHAPGAAKVRLTLAGRGIDDTAEVLLRVRRPEESHRRTFLSEIDASVQYYAVLPAQKPSPDNALVLTLHGAGVEAQGQVDSYGARDWATLVGPTNRRPYGFDWEDWGRLDALEALNAAQRRYPHDPRRIQLTGHSMGGHGAWSLGALFPGRFAAIGPSAGWISFLTYAGNNQVAGDDPVAALLRRAANQHDTLRFQENLRQARISILHGDADDNVPVTEARAMRQALQAMGHPALLYYEQPGAGHWWDDDPAPGAACVDWQPLFRLFRASRLPDDPDRAALVTLNPAVSAASRWMTIEQQEKILAPSSLQLEWKPADGRVVGNSENVRRFALERPGLRLLEIDGQKIAREAAADGTTRWEKAGGRWRETGAVPARQKNPARGGPFKQAFARRFALVYGTQGTPEENAALYARARFDAETFYYRGNGAPDLLADTAYDPKALRDRSVILYGNAETNALWKTLLKGAPIDIRRGAVRVGAVEKRGGELACLFVWPKPGADAALVGVVGCTGLPGLRLSERLPYFVSGVAYPDWVVASAEVLTEGSAGVLGAGYFGNDWTLAAGESAWR